MECPGGFGRVQSRERNERLSLRIVGACFIALAIYIAYEAASDLISRKAPEHSIPGIVLACVSLIVMPIPARAKKRVADDLGSAAMKLDAKQTDFCVYLSVISFGRPLRSPRLAQNKRSHA
jgi:divalent metal cation (Fe/Co/Zn/Cd) transporter